MIVDVLMPAYEQPARVVRQKLEEMLAFSRCKCVFESLQTIQALALELSRGKRKAIFRQDLDAAGIHHPSECPKGKHDLWVAPEYSGAIIHWSRNELVQAMRPESQWALFCDADIIPEADYLDRLLAHDKDIAAGLCTKRIDPPEPNFRIWLESAQNYGVLLKWAHHGKLIEVDAVGTGFLLVRRSVFEHMALAYHREAFLTTGNGHWFEYIRTPHGGEWGEDISFCWKAQRLGYHIYVDTSVVPHHVGDYYYNVEDFFPYQQDRIEGKGTEEKPEHRIETLEVFEPVRSD